ncbi:ribosome silencing factor [Candidatus Margulisiibacteriota bacterium]
MLSRTGPVRSTRCCTKLFCNEKQEPKITRRKLDPVEIIVEAAEAKQAQEIKVIGQMIIMTGESTPQLKALSREIGKHFKSVIWEGDPGSGWMILDTGSMVVHLMLPEERSYYNLEELWGKTGIVFHY